jgi:hypothetical protein
VGPRASLDAVEKRQSLASAMNRTLGRPAGILVIIPTEPSRNLFGYVNKNVLEIKKIWFNYNIIVLGFEVLTGVVMKSTILWDITQCSPLSVNRCFGGTYCLHLQARKISSSRWRLYVLPKRGLTLNGIYGVTSQKMVLFTMVLVWNMFSRSV